MVVNQTIFKPNGYSVVVDGNYIRIVSHITNKIILEYTTRGLKLFLLGNDSHPSIFEHINWLKTQTDYIPIELREFVKVMPEIPNDLLKCSSFEELELKLIAIYGI